MRNFVLARTLPFILMIIFDSCAVWSLNRNVYHLVMKWSYLNIKLFKWIRESYNTCVYNIPVYTFGRRVGLLPNIFSNSFSFCVYRDKYPIDDVIRSDVIISYLHHRSTSFNRSLTDHDFICRFKQRSSSCRIVKRIRRRRAAKSQCAIQIVTAGARSDRSILGFSSPLSYITTTQHLHRGWLDALVLVRRACVDVDETVEVKSTLSLYHILGQM